MAGRIRNDQVQHALPDETDGAYEETTYDDAIDAFLAHYPVSGELFWVDVEDATQQTMHLRYDVEIDHPAVNWVDDYRYEGRIP